MKKVETFVVRRQDYELVTRAMLEQLGFHEDAIVPAVRTALHAAQTGVGSHSAPKLGSLLGFSKEAVLDVNRDGVPVRVRGTPGSSTTVWDAQKSLGCLCVQLAMDDIVAAIQAGAGIAQVIFYNATHFLMPAIAIETAVKHGLIIEVRTTAARSEVVPLGGLYPVLGTNPITMIYPIAGGDMVFDSSSAAFSFGNLHKKAAAGEPLPPGTAVDEHGIETLDAGKAKSVKVAGRLGHGISIAIELLAAFCGGSRPTIRGKHSQPDSNERTNCVFHFLAIDPKAIAPLDFACGRTQEENVRAVVDDILKNSDGHVLIPGSRRAQNMELAIKYGGPLLPQAQAEEFIALSRQVGLPILLSDLEKVEIEASLLQ